jgi:hypothetical protein
MLSVVEARDFRGFGGNFEIGKRKLPNPKS